MIKVKDDIDLKELEKYGFEWNEYFQNYAYFKDIDGVLLYSVHLSTRHPRELMVNIFKECHIASSLQTLIYDMTMEGVLEKV